MDDNATFIGTGRANLSGGSATITTPKDVAELLGLGDDGLDVAYFEKDGRIIMVPSSEVTFDGSENKQE